MREQTFPYLCIYGPAKLRCSTYTVTAIARQIAEGSVSDSAFTASGDLKIPLPFGRKKDLLALNGAMSSVVVKGLCR